MNNIIEVKNLTKVFRGEDNIDDTTNKVLDNINLTIKKGEFVSIMGPSGCGKSTLLYLLGGLDKPTSGSIEINGKNINQIKEIELEVLRRKEIGFVFQFYNLVQNLTVEENIMLPVIMDGNKAADYKQKLNEILEIVGLSHKRKCLPRQLSGGQQQRVAIARAIILSPSLILADEPIGNLDSKSGTQVMELFKKINEKEKITIVQVTHSSDSANYGNRIINLKDGHIV